MLYQLATGAGKTVVFAAVLDGAVRKGRRCAVLVHRRELVKQAAAKLADAGVPHGVVAAGLDCDHDAPVLVLSVQTAARRLDRLPVFDFVVIDEAHHAVAATWRMLLERWPDAKVLGVTATPVRADGKGLGVAAGGLFDALVIGAPVSELQGEGYLARVRCFVPARQIDTSGLRTRLGDFEAGALADRASAVTGDAVVEYRRHADHLPAIAYGCTVAHAFSIAEAFCHAGYRAACVHGGMRADERDALIGGLGKPRDQAGAIEVLASCDLISEGLDVPAIGAVLMLRPTQSLALALQQIGRGMRPAPGKSHLVVLDHAGNALRHGLPEHPRAWSLDGAPEGGGAGRVGADGFGTWRCEACGHLGEADETGCSHCGAPRPETVGKRKSPNVVDGKLREIGADQFAHVVRLRYSELIRVPRTRAELQAYARLHGYKPGWVWHRLREQDGGSQDPAGTE